MSREDPQMKIRLPEELKARIEASAQASGRSMNAEIVTRLAESFVLADDTIISAAVDVVIKDWEHDAAVNRLGLMLRSYEDQLSFVRQRVLRERRVLTSLRELLAQAQERGDTTQAERLEAEIAENETWWQASEVESDHLTSMVNQTRKDLEHARAVAKMRPQQSPSA